MARYAEIEHIELFGIPQAFASLPAEKKNAALDRASRDADGLIGNAYKLPLVSWDDDLRGWVVDIACWYLLSNRNFDPMGNDAEFRLRYEDAMKALLRISTGNARLLNAVDSSPTTYEGGSYVVTRTRRGWGS